MYSIKSPSLDFDDDSPFPPLTPISANVTLGVNPEWPAGRLSFALLWDTNYPGSNFTWSVDGEYNGGVPLPSSDNWMTFEIELPNGALEVTWEYIYNPTGIELPPEFEDGGVIYLDDVAFILPMPEVSVILHGTSTRYRLYCFVHNPLHKSHFLLL